MMARFHEERRQCQTQLESRNYLTEIPEYNSQYERNRKLFSDLDLRSVLSF